MSNSPPSVTVAMKIDGDQVLESLFAVVVADEVAFALEVPVEVAVASTLAIELLAAAMLAISLSITNAAENDELPYTETQ